MPNYTSTANVILSVNGKQAQKMLSQLEKDARRLEKQMGFAALQRCISYVDESAQSTGNKNRWKDWSLILRRCYEGKWYEKNVYGVRNPVPMGATGHLGQAELEAIQQVLRTDLPDVDVPGKTGASF